MFYDVENAGRYFLILSLYPLVVVDPRDLLRLDDWEHRQVLYSGEYRLSCLYLLKSAMQSLSFILPVSFVDEVVLNAFESHFFYNY